ncbi:endonuclease/exonuclease/phosphatase family protein [Rhizobium leguminosarum]|uniref:endonuclease/exonuclease/phosphatase family protein n=1 Tax=Rhizobium leguminosarum TaxID=384 RepID=UPI0032B2D991
MNFASYNIQYGFGLDGRYDLARIARSLEGADVIALQEVTRGFSRNGFADMVADVAGFFPDYLWVYGPACDMHVEAAEGRLQPVPGTRFQFGNMVLSRWPIVSTRTLLLPRSRTIGKINPQRGATEAVIAAPGGAIRVYSVHLDHVSADERIRQLEFLNTHINAFVREGGSLTGGGEFDLPEPPLPEDYVIMGDFNMEPESPEYARSPVLAADITAAWRGSARRSTPLRRWRLTLRGATAGWILRIAANACISIIVSSVVACRAD